MLEKSAKPSSVFRVDKFVVPATARQEFLEKVGKTHELLGTMKGCLQNLVLEQESGPGAFNFVTIVEWGGVEAIENAKSAVMALHSQIGLKPQELFARLGITADLANYRTL